MISNKSRELSVDTTVSSVREEWEHLGATDPMWAVLNDPARTNGRWDEEEFFASGVREVETLFAWLQRLNVETNLSGSAVDFGCGVGRLTRALAGRFQSALGVDCSESMINLAKTSSDIPNLKFFVNPADDLAALPTENFDFGLTLIVLQHIPPPGAMTYLAELLRLVKPGGVLVFQVPTDFSEPTPDIVSRIRTGWRSLRATIGLRTRLKNMLRRSDTKDSARIVRMFCLAENDLRELFKKTGVDVVGAAYTNSCDADYNGALVITEDAPTDGYTSRLFAVRKR